VEAIPDNIIRGVVILCVVPIMVLQKKFRAKRGWYRAHDRNGTRFALYPLLYIAIGIIGIYTIFSGGK
jgi:hypothetical protein